MKRLMKLLLAGIMVISTISLPTVNAEEKGEYYTEKSQFHVRHLDESYQGELPSAYNASEHNLVTTVKNQGNTTISWAYSVISAAETQLIKKGFQMMEDADLSELQFAYSALNLQGDDLNVMEAQPLSTANPQLSYTDAPFTPLMAISYLQKQSTLIMEEDFLANQLTPKSKPAYVVGDTILLNQKNHTDIKKAIIDYGSVVAAYYQNSDLTKAYLPFEVEQTANHMAVLVGYDDTFSKELFKREDGTMPQYDGAWIIKNSYGTEVGDKGYFYLSYEMPLSDVCAFEIKEKDETLRLYNGDQGNNLYKSANYGWAKEDAKFATTEMSYEIIGESGNYIEYLEAVTVGLADPNVSYEIDVYRTYENYATSKSGTKLNQEPITGEILYPGFYTITLPEAYELHVGDRFVIVVRLQSAYLEGESNQKHAFLGFLASNSNALNGYQQTSLKAPSGREVYGTTHTSNSLLTNNRTYTCIYGYTRMADKNHLYNQIMQLSEEYKVLKQSQYLTYETRANIEQISNFVSWCKLNYGVEDEKYQALIDEITDRLTSAREEEALIKSGKDGLEVVISKCQSILASDEMGYLYAEAKNMIQTACQHAMEVWEQDDLEKEQYIEESLALLEAITETKHAIQNGETYKYGLKSIYNSVYNCITGENKGHYQAETLANAQQLLETAKPYVDGYVTVDIMQAKQNELTQCYDKLYGESTLAKRTILKIQEKVQSLKTIYQNWDVSYLNETQHDAMNQLFTDFESLLEVNSVASYYEEEYMKFEKAFMQFNEIVCQQQEAKDEELSSLRQKMREWITLYDELKEHEEDYEGWFHFESQIEKLQDLLFTTSTDQVTLNRYLNDVESAYGKVKLMIPNNVTRIQAEPYSYKEILLSWNDAYNADEYLVYRKSADSASYVLYATTTDTQMLITVKTGKEYFFKVFGKNHLGVSESAKEVAAMTTLTGSLTLSSEKISNTKFKLSWNKVDGATRYILYRRFNQGSYKKILTLGGDVTSYTTSSLVKGTYDFILKSARYDSKERVFGPASKAVTLTSVFAKPTVTLKALSKSAKVSWDKVEGVKYYQVYQASSKSGTYKKVKTTTNTSATIKSLKTAKTYYFKVRGYSELDGTKVYTSFSSIKSVKIK